MTNKIDEYFQYGKEEENEPTQPGRSRQPNNGIYAAFLIHQKDSQELFQGIIGN